MSELTPFVPRLLLDWQAEETGSMWREVDGTLVFMDISGFTAMSERLSKKGKVGAEEVTDIINATFTDLLRVAYEVEGSLLKFGGDALLLFFEGDQHALRACYAAAEMRSALQSRGRIQTSAGSVSLQMSVGINSGEFQFFLVGSSHRELILTGPEATWTVLMESAAGVGEILLSPSTAMVVGDSYLGAEKSGGRLLRSFPDRTTRPDITSISTDVDVSRFIPTSIRGYLEGGGGDPEHRQVTVSFIRFGDLDGLMLEVGIEEVASRLGELITTVQAAVDEYEICFLGTDIDRSGGKIILTAGAPEAHEDDEERMLRAVRRLAGRGCEIDLSIGVHTGHVFAGAIGPFYRRTYTVMGDAVNTAARVMTNAPSREILATWDVLDLSNTEFETKEMPPLQVKGKREPLITYSVGHPLARRRKTRRDLPLFGRQKELAALLDSAEQAAFGKGATVSLVGPAGIGKSRLIEELLTTSALPSVVGTCEQYQAAVPYFLVRQILEQILGIEIQDEDSARQDKLTRSIESRAPHLVAWMPLIAVPLDLEIDLTPDVEGLDDEFRKERLGQVVVNLASALKPEPTIWVIEDADWMDEASKDLIRRMAELTEGGCWLFCITSRDPLDELIGPSASVIHLEPLSHEAAIALARAAANKPLLPQHADILARRAGGHPLFVEELAQAGDEEVINLERLPETVEKAIAARIDDLTPFDRRLLRNMSIMGREIDLELVANITPEVPRPGLQRTLKRLSSFIEVEDGTARFKAALYRDVAYEGLPYRKRRALHERIGTLIEVRSENPEDHSEVLSMHFHQAFEFSKSWRYSLAAASRAEKKFALVGAVSFYRRATECARRLPIPPEEVASVWESLGVVLKDTGQFAEASDAYRRARKMTTARIARARLNLREGYVQERLGRYVSALRWFGKGLRLLDGSDLANEEESVRTELLTSTAEVRYFQGKIEAAIRVAREALQQAERIGDRLSMGRAYYILNNAYNYLRDVRAKEYGELALQIFKEERNLKLEANVLNNLGIGAYFRGEWNEALRLYRESKEAIEKTGHVLGGAVAANNMAEILSDQGRLDEAERMFEEALSTMRATAHSRMIYGILGNLGRAAARAGSHREAAGLLEESLAGFRQLGDEFNVSITEARVAENFLLEGRSAEALELVERLIATNPAGLGPMLHRIAGDAQLQMGRLGQAREHLDESLSNARTAQDEYETALGLEALGRLAALAGEDPSPYQHEAGRILQILGVRTAPATPLKQTGAG